MSRLPIHLLLLMLVVPLIVTAQVKDPRVDALAAETAELKRTVADQERRIAELEATVKTLQAVVAPKPQPIPAPKPAWQEPNSWNQIRKGMSEAQVTEILGPPTRVEAVTDMRTLYYDPDPRSTSTLRGSVALMDDRVTAMMPPAFQ